MTRWAIRLTFAYALLLQVVMGATAGTVHALAMQEAVSGALCTPSGSGEAPDGNPPHDLLCCTLGCAASQVAPILGAAEAVSLVAPPQAGTALAPAKYTAADLAAALPAFEARGPPARA